MMGVAGLATAVLDVRSPFLLGTMMGGSYGLVTGLAVVVLMPNTAKDLESNRRAALIAARDQHIEW